MQPTADPTSNHPRIRVLGQSQVRVPADLATLRVTLAGTGTTRARATAALRRAHGRLTRVLTRFDATVTHTHTHRTTLTCAPAPATAPATVPDIRWETTGDSAAETADGASASTGPTPALWTARADVSITVGDVAAIAALYAELGKVKPARMTGPAWSLREDHTAYAMVRREAVRDAVHRAKLMAEASGSDLEALEWIHDVEPGEAPNVDGTDPVGPGALVALPGEPPVQTVRVTVRAQYRIAPVVFPRTNER